MNGGSVLNGFQRNWDVCNFEAVIQSGDGGAEEWRAALGKEEVIDRSRFRRGTKRIDTQLCLELTGKI